jgi:hypothetical protein
VDERDRPEHACPPPVRYGNGRVGRTLIHVIFRRRGIAPRNVPPVSLILAGRSDEYIKGLTAYRQEQEEIWYETFADAVEISARKAREFADSVAELQEQWFEKAGRPRPQAAARKLIAALPGHPVVDVGTVQELTVQPAKRPPAKRSAASLKVACCAKSARTRSATGFGSPSDCSSYSTHSSASSHLRHKPRAAPTRSTTTATTAGGQR